MSHGPYIQTRDAPQVAAQEQPDLGPRSKPIPRDPHGSRVPGWDTPADLSKPPAGIPDPATLEIPAELRAEIEGYVARYPDPRSAIIPALWAAQRLHGWCSPLAVRQVAAVLHRTPAELMAVATFYDQFETQPVGRHTVYVCTNISCSLRGADELLHAFEHAAAGREDEFHVRGFECLGACDVAPMISVDGVYAGPIDVGEVGAILDAVAAGEDFAPERQVKRRPSQDPAAGDRPSHGAAGPGTPAQAGQQPPAATGATGGQESVGDGPAGRDPEPHPGRESDPAVPSQDPEKDDAEEHRATGQDPEADKA